MLGIGWMQLVEVGIGIIVNCSRFWEVTRFVQNNLPIYLENIQNFREIKLGKT